ncbi:MAG TPA: PPOX class F420-dependent oxidoreductase [Pseudonocardiaceae bacterium]|jgi:PPOX class probable F420-dependent enzyme|nr:PPOX class F420-dependent oxidoreductase [Pseudonocardiaceae bacterium]
MTSTDGAPSLLTPTGTAALVTLKRDGRPQLSNVGYAYDAAAALIRISLTDDRAKTRNMRRDPRASLYLTTANLRAYLVVEGTVDLTPVAASPDDATVEELVELYREIGGEHPDWTGYRAAMVADKRLVARFHVERTYGWDGR